MAIFYLAVRNLLDFSLVAKLTKRVSKVRETVRKCEKIRQNDCQTFFMTSNSQKMISQFLDSYLVNFYRLVRVPAWLWNLEFCTKIGIKKSQYHFLRVWRHKKRFPVILTYFFALSDRFSHFWHVFCLFSWPAWNPLSYRPIKNRHLSTKF